MRRSVMVMRSTVLLGGGTELGRKRLPFEPHCTRGFLVLGQCGPVVRGQARPGVLLRRVGPDRAGQRWGSRAAAERPAAVPVGFFAVTVPPWRVAISLTSARPRPKWRRSPASGVGRRSLAKRSNIRGSVSDGMPGGRIPASAGSSSVELRRQSRPRAQAGQIRTSVLKGQGAQVLPVVVFVVSVLKMSRAELDVDAVRYPRHSGGLRPLTSCCAEPMRSLAPLRRHRRRGGRSMLGAWARRPVSRNAPSEAGTPSRLGQRASATRDGHRLRSTGLVLHAVQSEAYAGPMVLLLSGRGRVGVLVGRVSP